jgi:hypothetical protein
MLEIKESEEHPHFYEIPGFKRYCVSKSGVVINKITKCFLAGGYNPDGYFNYGLTSDIGHRLTFGRHRLIAFVFIERNDDIASLVVNHINGKKR